VHHWRRYVTRDKLVGSRVYDLSLSLLGVYLSIILPAMHANLFDIGNAASELHVESVSGIAEPMPYRCPASSFNQRNNQRSITWRNGRNGYRMNIVV